MGADFDHGRGKFVFSSTGARLIGSFIAIDVFKLNWDDRASFRVLDFKGMVFIRELEPMISIELSYKFTV